MVDKSIHIFDRDLLRKKRRRAEKHFGDYDFLFQWTHDALQDRLKDIMREFPRRLQIGARGGVLNGAVVMDIDDAFAPQMLADEEFLPIKDGSLDLVYSALSLHSVNDLPGALVQIRKALKPDGLFIAAMFGGETLYELRESLMHSEVALNGGASPRVFPFADKQQAGALLQRAGFALPVVDSDIVTVTYDTMFKLLSDVRGMGESNIIAARNKGYAGKDFFMEAARHYHEHYAEEDGRVPASFEILFMIGWAPHDSQQKPLTPGSAETRLADALKTEETPL